MVYLQKLKHSASTYGSNNRDIILQSSRVTPGSAALLSSSHEMLISDCLFPWSNRIVRASSSSLMVNALCNQHSGTTIPSSSPAKPKWHCPNMRRIKIGDFFRRSRARIECWAAKRFRSAANRFLRQVIFPSGLPIPIPSKKVLFFLVLVSCALLAFCIGKIFRGGFQQGRKRINKKSNGQED